MKKRIIFLVLGAVFLVGALGCGAYIYLHTGYTPPTVSEQYTPAPTAPPTPTPTAAPTEAPTPTPTPFVSAVNFEYLHGINPDIYAWLKINNTNIDYPVLQSESDDDYYLNRDSDGNWSANGSIFSQHQFNDKSFDEPVTVLYGHRMGSGAMFGNLRSYYTDNDWFKDNRIMRIYTPDKYLEYKVFCCAEYNNDNIMYWNDFTTEDGWNGFFEGVYNNTDLLYQLDESCKPTFGEDKVLILSTCLERDRSMRFLVMGVLQTT